MTADLSWTSRDWQDEATPDEPFDAADVGKPTVDAAWLRALDSTIQGLIARDKELAAQITTAQQAATDAASSASAAATAAGAAQTAADEAKTVAAGVRTDLDALTAVAVTSPNQTLRRAEIGTKAENDARTGLPDTHLLLDRG